jgi:hypothetical protein
MAEPLGIVGVIGVAVQLIQTCTELHSDWKNAPADAKNFILELQNLKTILSEMNRNVIENPKFAKAFYGEHSSLLAEFDPHRKTETKAMLSVCKDELDGLLQRLEKRRDGPRLGWERLKAAFDGPGARQAVTNLQRRCLSLSLLLQPDMALLAADTRQEVKEGREEQKQHHQTQMLAELEKLQSSSRPKVNIFATSRPNIPDIMENFKGHPWLEILASREDIQQYLEGHMDELGPVVNQSQDIQQEIIDGILDAADGM